MTAFSEFKASLADWANRQDWSDSLITSFVRSAEAKFNEELRIDRMMQLDNGLIVGRNALLPDDWLEMSLVRIADPGATDYPDGLAPIDYKPRTEFFSTDDTNATGYYTIEGRTIYFGGKPDLISGISYQISYYGEVPIFSDTIQSWIYTKFPTMYRAAALMHADLHAVGEEDKAQLMKQLAEDEIQKLNVAHRFSKASGSKLNITRMRGRSFG